MPENSENSVVSVSDVVVEVQEAQTFLRNLWENHQDDVILFAKSILITLVIIVLAWLVCRIVRKAIFKAVAKVPQMDMSVGKILYAVARTFIWLFAFLIALDRFGVNTASILTVLGAAGLAVGLAMKDSLSNIAAGLMLLILRPYKLGDFIDSGSISGTIEDMGLFTTTLKTFDGVFIAAPNNVIFGAPVKNYSRNPLRMANINVGIAYGDSLVKALEVLQTYMANHELILKDPAPQVLVTDLADSSVNLTLRFWTTTENYWPAFWGVKEELKNTIESAGLNIPFPQRVVTFLNPPETK